MRKALGGFGLLAGATYPFRALRVFRRNPHLWGYLVTPILINVVVGIFFYAGLLFFGWQSVEALIIGLSNWIDRLIVDLPAWLSVLEYLILGLGFVLRLLLILGLLLITGFLFTQFGVFLGSPWYGQLSEQLEKIRTGEVQTIEVGIVRDLWRAILFELKKLVFALGVGLLFLLLNLLPGVGTVVTAVGSIVLTATLVCLDFLDAPSERRRLSFRKKLKIVLRSLPASASFSLVCLGLISIPLLNLVTIPICVASGTLFWCDRILPKRFWK